MEEDSIILLQIGNKFQTTVLYSEGYKIEFLKKPPSFSGIRHTEIPKDPEKRNIILKEVKSLLEKKNAKEIVEPQNSDAWFYSTIFIVPKQLGGFRAILNLRKLTNL